MYFSLCIASIDWSIAQGIAKDFFVPLAGAAAGAWATLEVFKRQSRMQAEEAVRAVTEENARQDSQADRNLSHFVWLLEDLVKFAKQQNQDYLDTASNLKTEPLKQHYIITRASGTLNRILSLKQDDIYFSFIRKALDTEENRNHVAAIYREVDLINQLIDSVKLKYQEHLETFDRIGSEYREVIEEVRDLVIERTTAARKSHSIYLDPLALYLAEVSRNYLDAIHTLPEAVGLDWQHEHYLWPLQRTLVKEFDDDDRIVALATRGRRGLILVGRIKHSSRDTVEILQKDSGTLIKAIDDLEGEIRYIKSVLTTTQPNNIQSLIK